LRYLSIAACLAGVTDSGVCSSNPRLQLADALDAEMHSQDYASMSPHWELTVTAPKTMPRWLAEHVMVLQEIHAREDSQGTGNCARHLHEYDRILGILLDLVCFTTSHPLFLILKHSPRQSSEG
jgi:hypothetical protein